MESEEGSSMQLSPLQVIDGHLETPLPDDGAFQASHRTPPELADIEQDLIAREPLFHRQEHGISRRDIERMTARGFWEVSASGRRYSREYVLDTLEQRYAHTHVETWHIGNYRTQRIAPGLFLFSHTLRQGERVTRRATIWTRKHGDWQVVYHQGTVVAS